MNKITTVNGVLVAAQSDFASHAQDKMIHLTEEERIAWNAKADASALSGKVDTSTFAAHETNTTVHVSQEEKEKWNARNTKGAVVATQDGLDAHTENTTAHITGEERAAWNAASAIPGASNAFTGDNTHAGTETFNNIVNINNDIAINGKSLNSFLYQQALLSGVFQANKNTMLEDVGTMGEVIQYNCTGDKPANTTTRDKWRSIPSQSVVDTNDVSFFAYGSRFSWANGTIYSNLSVLLQGINTPGMFLFLLGEGTDGEGVVAGVLKKYFENNLSINDIPARAAFIVVTEDRKLRVTTSVEEYYFPSALYHLFFVCTHHPRIKIALSQMENDGFGKDYMETSSEYAGLPPKVFDLGNGSYISRFVGYATSGRTTFGGNLIPLILPLRINSSYLINNLIS